MTSIVTVTNGEHEYIREWIEYHLNIGVELICIGFNGPSQQFDFMPRYDRVRYFDFSYDNQCRPSESLIFDENKFTESDKLENEYNSLYEMKPLQKIHNIMIDTIRYLYPKVKFCAIIDVDEFLVINNTNYVNDIDKLLVEKFPDANSSFFVSRIYYGDNNHIYYDDNKSVMERFFSYDNYCECGYENGLFRHNKIIINLWHDDTKANKCRMLSKYNCGLSHTMYRLLMRDLECANFFTKSFEEHIKKWSTKQNRRNMLSNYFKYVNEMTDEKFKALPELLNKYNITDYNLLRDEENKELRNTYKKFLENQ